jgi:hypothetical protein
MSRNIIFLLIYHRHELLEKYVGLHKCQKLILLTAYGVTYAVVADL